MDPRDNPYTPNAGARPPALVGREDELAAFDVLLARLARGSTDQSVIVTGLRGVGKTVLLGEFRIRAEAQGWVAVEAEITRHPDFGLRMAQLTRRALLQLAPKARWKDRARRAAGVLKAFTITVSSNGALTAGLDVEAAEGMADTGEIVQDLADLVVALGEVAKESGRGVVFLFDEIQHLPRVDFEALIAALHKSVQRALPITFVGAGLPQMPRLAGEAKSYSERLFRFPSIGRLPREQALRALVQPASDLGVAFTDEAADEIVAFTEGYPYFIQEYGRIVWDEAVDAPISAADVAAVRPLVAAKLDGSFFRVRAERTTPLELSYLRAMAELGAEPQKAGEVAAVLKRGAAQVGPTRARLIEKGLLYTPGYGLAAFTVPQFDKYLLRTLPLAEDARA
ncbi:MAG: ATP-binding protein [Actinomycetes bacterium]